VIDVVGTNPVVTSCSEIPASSVMFIGSKATISLSREACSSLTYKTCVCGKQVTVFQVFIRQAPGAVTATVTPSSALVNLAPEEQTEIVFTVCLNNTNSTPLNGFILSGTLTAGDLNIVSVGLPDGFNTVGTNGFFYQLDLNPGESPCFTISAVVSCAGTSGLTFLTKTVMLTSNGVSGQTTAGTALVNCHSAV
jgi:hypothetical protein